MPESSGLSDRAAISTGDLARRVVAAQVAAIITSALPTQDGDVDALHDMRVATRRARSALNFFDDALPSGARAFGNQLQTLTRALGTVRDLDVQRHRFATWSVVDPVIAIVEKMLAERRERAFADLTLAIRDPSYVYLLANLVALASDSPLPALADPTALPLVERIRPLRRKVRRLGERLTASRRPSSGDLHRLRIRVKKLRYALEFVEPVLGMPAGRLAERARALQDLLGEYQDRVVAVDLLRAIARDKTTNGPLDVETTVSILKKEGRALRARFPRAFRRLTGGRWREVGAALRGQVANHA